MTCRREIQKKSGRALTALPGLAYSLHISVVLALFVHLLTNVANTIKVINNPIISHLPQELLVDKFNLKIVTMPWQSSNLNGCPTFCAVGPQFCLYRS